MAPGEGAAQGRSAFELSNYRLAGQEREILGEGWAPFREEEEPEPSGPTGFKAKVKSLTAGEWLILLFSVAGLVTIVSVFASGRQLTTVAVLALVALAPLGLVMLVLLRADRFAPVGVRPVIFAALWGAGVAGFLAGIVNSSLYSDLLLSTGDFASAEIRTAVFIAPVSEEVLKGAGVAIVLTFYRSRVVSTLNGLAIGGTVGAAFAFVENISYFLEAHAEGTTLLGATIVGRAVMSPFVHPMATSFTGFFIALVLLRQSGRWRTAGLVSVGLLLAIFLHALWNGLATLALLWLLLYLVVEVPLFIGWLVWIAARGRKELSIIRRGLTSFEAAGWISPQELAAITTIRGRKHARKWARKVGREAAKAMRTYFVSAGRLGADQVNMERFGPSFPKVELAQRSLLTLTQSRRTFLDLGELASRRD